MYIVTAYKKYTGKIQESEEYTDYGKAFTFAMECLNSDQYKAITILKRGHGVNIDKFFLHRIIK